MTTLIFPANNSAGRAYAAAAAERGEEVVLATSDKDVPGHWWLPTIHDADFASRFFVLRSDLLFNIDRVVCPVASVHAFMRKFILEHALGIRLIGASPIQQEMDKHRALMQRAEELAPITQLPLLEAASVLKHAAAIYGESSDDKLAAMMGAFHSAPKGRVVEIGSLAGRTAFVLCYMAKRYHIGCVTTIDPWSATAGVQHDSPQTLTDLTMEWNWDKLAEIFTINLLPFAHNHSHLRETAAAAFDNHPQLNGIAILHVDGNHDYLGVKHDCESWCSRMLPNSWLILDDYIWAHGDGPKRAGDELLARNSTNIEKQFECGKALFVKFKGVPV